MRKKVLVTGADGFIGSHLCEELVNQGYQVKAFSFYNSFNWNGWLESIPSETFKNIEIVAGDIRDGNFVNKAVKGVDQIFHLAALIAIPYSYHSPASYVETNIKGTLNILQAAREFNVEKTLITSTSEVYGTAKYVPIDEKHPLQGQSPYSATKIGADRLTESYWRSFGLPVVIVRPFNTYGPRQSARAIIPTIITQLLNGENTILLGDLSPTRDLVYVKDTVNGFIKIAQSVNKMGEEVNICTGIETSMKDLCKILIKKINPKAKVKKDSKRVRPQHSEVDRLLGSYNKLKKLTGWTPMYNLNEGLEKTVLWFSDKDNLKYYKHKLYNL